MLNIKSIPIARYTNHNHLIGIIGIFLDKFDSKINMLL